MSTDFDPADGLDRALHQSLYDQRAPLLVDPLEQRNGNRLCQGLLLLAAEDAHTSAISLYINSPGGSIPATLAIYDAMQFVRPRVETTCVGQAAATSALLLAGGAPGRRSILTHGRVVIHAPAAEGRGTVPDLILEAEEVERVRTMQEEILAMHTDRSAAQVREDTERDLVLTPAAALEYGVVDAVLSGRG